MFSVLVLLEDSKNVWSDHLRQKMANPAAKNRFFHFRHAVGCDQYELCIDDYVGLANAADGNSKSRK